MVRHPDAEGPDDASRQLLSFFFQEACSNSQPLSGVTLPPSVGVDLQPGWDGESV